MYLCNRMEAMPALDYKALYEQEKLKNEALHSALSSLQITTAALRHELDQLKKMIFGSRHERFVAAQNNPAQLTLDIVAGEVAGCSVIDAKKIEYTRTTVAQNPIVHPGRTKLPEHLRREKIVI